MYNTISAITLQEYQQVRQEDDILPTYEMHYPDMRKYLVEHFNYMLRYWGKESNVLEIKCTLFKDIATNQTGCMYLTKEKKDGKYIYMKYPLLEKPETIYENEIFRIKSPEEFAAKMGTLKAGTSTFEAEKQTEVYIRRFLSSMDTFEESELTEVRVAQNRCCNTVRLSADNVFHISEVCKHIIQSEGKLVPFCQVCGDLTLLWKFGRNYILCEFCFKKQFREAPSEVVQNNSLSEAIKIVRSIPYSEYKKHVAEIHKGADFEYYTLDEKNYERGIELLYSPDFVHILNTLSKKQQDRLQFLSAFFLLRVCSKMESC